jgi:catechol 2,3-dioxygenase-like lactoylglutathione lyase family enzyme
MSNPAFKFDHVHIISEDPRASAQWYVEMFGATIAADTIARGAPQIFVDLGGMTILIRGRRPGEAPEAARPIRPYADFSSHNALGNRPFRFSLSGRSDGLLRRASGQGRGFSGRVEARRERQPLVLRRCTGWRQHRADAVLIDGELVVRI